MVLKTLSKTASISLKHNHFKLDDQQHLAALLENPPLLLSIQQLKVTVPTCALCRLLYSEIKNAVPENAESVFVYRCEDIKGRLDSLWIYYGYSRIELARIYCYADEGQFQT